MKKPQKLALVSEFIARAESLRSSPQRSGDSDFMTWRGDVRSFLHRAAPDRVQEFEDIGFSLLMITRSTTESALQRAFHGGLERSVGFLKSVARDIELYERDEQAPISGDAAALERVVAICLRFPAAARLLAKRYADRPGIEQKDEYDVQDVLHAFLRLDFDDVRPEEWTPSYAGSSARMDFLLPDHRIVVEVKRTREKLGAKDVKEQLAIDIDHYRKHPGCGALVCFVYDPDHRISNKAGFEKDLAAGREGEPVVRVVIAPRD